MWFSATIRSTSPATASSTAGRNYDEWTYLPGALNAKAVGQPFLPGDLLYWSNNGAASGIHHVALYLGDNQMVEEYETGTNARVTSFRPKDFFGALRPYSDTYSLGAGATVNGGIDDVSGDGHADLVWSNGRDVEYLGNSSSTNPGGLPFDGTNVPVVRYLPAGALTAAGSVTGHAGADLFVYDPGKDQVKLYPNTGGASYAGIGYVVAHGFGGVVKKIFAADLTGDGFDELVWTMSDGTVWYLPNSMGSHVDGLPFTGENKIEIASGVPLNAVVAFGDFDHDKYADMVYVDGGNLFYLHNEIASNGNGQPFIPNPGRAEQLTTDDGFAAVRQMTAADVSGDGAADLLWTDDTGTAYYLPNNASTNPNGAFFYGSSLNPVTGVTTLI